MDILHQLKPLYIVVEHTNMTDMVARVTDDIEEAKKTFNEMSSEEVPENSECRNLYIAKVVKIMSENKS